MTLDPATLFSSPDSERELPLWAQRAPKSRGGAQNVDFLDGPRRLSGGLFVQIVAPEGDC